MILGSAVVSDRHYLQKTLRARVAAEMRSVQIFLHVTTIAIASNWRRVAIGGDTPEGSCDLTASRSAIRSILRSKLPARLHGVEIPVRAEIGAHDRDRDSDPAVRGLKIPGIQ